MKQLKFWLMSLAILCSCTNEIEEPVNNDLMTKSVNKTTVTITLSFGIEVWSGPPASLPIEAMIHCDVDPDIDFDTIEFPLYNIWRWNESNWEEVYKTGNFVFDKEETLYSLPYTAGPNTAVCKKDIKIYPTSLEDEYEFVFISNGLPLVENRPDNTGPDDDDDDEGGGGEIIENPDTFLRIKEPIEIITK